ncbi:MAG: 3-oxoacyl-ACP reductase FabG [Calditrichaeota bacterium]|nr:3-oxoacyl-ACP reductase FabG [Calditrichota bacterium]
MDIRLDGKKALVTGASTGIGRAIALKFAESGADVVLHYHRSREKAEESVSAIRKLGRKSLALQADFSKTEDITHVIEQTAAFFDGEVDILVNNAGTLLQRTPFAEASEDYWDRLMAINLKSVFMCSQKILPYMKEGSRIINISSVAARTGGGPGSVLYAAAKGGVSTLTMGMAKEFIQRGIWVNAIAPGVIDTPFHERFTPPDVRQKFLQSIPLGREGTADEIASVAVFLASRYSDYLVGAILDVNGGMWVG